MRKLWSLFGRVLELGCGTGYYGMYFADMCAEYTGIDITPENIEIFNRKIKEKKRSRA